MMEVKIEAIEDVICHKHFVKKGDVIRAEFSQFGVSLLFGNCWSLEYKYDVIRKYFKVYNQ